MRKYEKASRTCPVYSSTIGDDANHSSAKSSKSFAKTAFPNR